MPPGGFYEVRFVQGLYYLQGEKGLFTLNAKGVFTSIKLPQRLEVCPRWSLCGCAGWLRMAAR